MKKRQVVFSGFLLGVIELLNNVPALSAEVETVYSMRLLGGQYFLSGDQADFSGNGSAFVAPAVRVGERWTWVGALSGSFQGTKQALDPVGAGTLATQEMDYLLSVKGLKQDPDSRWVFKPSAGYSREFLKETRDEKWGKGLFDYEKGSLGAEWEYVYRDPFSLRMGYDSYYLRFPNYDSLESRASSQFAGLGLSREMAGRRVLDSLGNSVFLGGSFPFSGRWLADAQLSAGHQFFPAQKVVLESGDLSEVRRSDFLTQAEVSVELPRSLNPDNRLTGYAGLGVALNVSNQNTFDAFEARFLGRSYTYTEFTLRPGIQIALGSRRRPALLGVGMVTWLRRYPDRPAQNSSGLYLADNLWTLRWMASAALSYPLLPRLKAIAHWQYSRSDSNQEFEQFYKYRYGTMTYLFGFSYDY